MGTIDFEKCCAVEIVFVFFYGLADMVCVLPADMYKRILGIGLYSDNISAAEKMFLPFVKYCYYFTIKITVIAGKAVISLFHNF